MRILMWHCVTEMIIFFLALLGEITLFLSTGKYYKEKLWNFFFSHQCQYSWTYVLSLSFCLSLFPQSLSSPHPPGPSFSSREDPNMCVSIQQSRLR